jgi:hypothetical protein
MPNWCECTLKIAGDPNDVRRCLASMATPDSESDDQRLFDFKRVIPLPIELRERMGAPCIADSNGWDVVDQISRLWGTKWNADSVTIEHQPDGGGAVIRFDTAWDPPGPIIETLADRFPSLAFDFDFLDDEGMKAGRAWRAPGRPWAFIDARGNGGFCQAALDAKSWPLDAP